MYATYDVLYEAHRNSAASFQEIVETIQSIIYSIAELDTDEEKERVSLLLLLLLFGGEEIRSHSQSDDKVYGLGTEHPRAGRFRCPGFTRPMRSGLTFLLLFADYARGIGPNDGGRREAIRGGGGGGGGG